MKAFRCYDHVPRIYAMPVKQWAAEVEKLPSDCGHRDCTTRNCQQEVKSRLRDMWEIRRNKREYAA